jgi:flagellar biosynthetic protein FliP
MRTTTALLIVIATIALLRSLCASRGWIPGTPRRRSLKVLETLSLVGRQRLFVVEVEGERLLLGSGDATINVLRSLGPAPEADTEQGTEGQQSERRAPGLLRALRSAAPVILIALIVAGASTALAAPGPEPDASGLGDIAGAIASATQPQDIAATLQIVTLLTLISMAPSILLMATCFTRVVIVLAFLRQAIGVQQLPPNQVLIGLALFVTFFVMAPVGERIHSEALEPYMRQEIGGPDAAKLAAVPVREFLSVHTREDDLALLESFRKDPPDPDAAVSLSTLLPAYLMSELRTAFEIGFMLYLPFLVIDLMIASMLTSMGMIVLPPIVISLPFKLMLFVLLDGWNLVIGSLLSGLT